MRIIGVASIVFASALLLTFVISGFGPPVTAQRLAGQSGDDERRHRNGQAIFRFDTFGDEQLWTDVLRMHEVTATVDPATALAVGLKIDVESLPPKIIAALRVGQVSLSSGSGSARRCRTRHRSATFRPASPSFTIARICSSVNLLCFIRSS
jgi:hypothetical protein